MNTKMGNKILAFALAFIMTFSNVSTVFALGDSLPNTSNENIITSSNNEGENQGDYIGDTQTSEGEEPIESEEPSEIIESELPIEITPFSIRQPVDSIVNGAIQVVMVNNRATPKSGTGVNTDITLVFSNETDKQVNGYADEFEIRVALPANYSDLFKFQDGYINSTIKYNKYDEDNDSIILNAETTITLNEIENYLSIKFDNYDFSTMAGQSVGYPIKYIINNGTVLNETEINFDTTFYLNGTEISETIIPKPEYKVFVQSEKDAFTSGASTLSLDKVKVTDEESGVHTWNLNNNSFYYVAYGNVNANYYNTTGNIYMNKVHWETEITIPNEIEYNENNLLFAMSNSYSASNDISKFPDWEKTVTRDGNVIKVTFDYEPQDITKKWNVIQKPPYIFLAGDFICDFKKPVQPKVLFKTKLQYMNVGDSDWTSVTIPDKATTFYKNTYYTDLQLEALGATNFGKNVFDNVETVKNGELVTFTFDEIKNLKGFEIQNLSLVDNVFDDKFELVSIYTGKRTVDSTRDQIMVQAYNKSGTNTYNISSKFDQTINVDGDTRFQEGFGFLFYTLLPNSEFIKAPSVTMRVKNNGLDSYGKMLKNQATLKWEYMYGGSTRTPVSIIDEAEVKYVYDEQETPILPPKSLAKTATNISRTGGINYPGDKIKYVLSIKNLSKDTELTKFAIQDLIDKNHDIDTIESVSFGLPSDSNLTLNSSKTSDVDKISVIDKTNPSSTKLLWYFDGELKPEETMTITYFVKIKTNVYNVTANNSFSLKLVSANNLLDTVDTARTSLKIDIMPPKVGIKVDYAKTEMNDTDEMTVYLTAKNFDYTNAGSPSHTLNSVLFSTYFNEGKFYSNPWSTNHPFSYVEGSAKIEAVDNLNPKVLTNVDISSASITYTNQKISDNNSTYQHYIFKVDGLDMKPKDNIITISFKVKARPEFFEGSDSSKIFKDATVTAAAYATIKYKNESGSDVDYTFPKLADLSVSDGWGSSGVYDGYVNPYNYRSYDTNSTTTYRIENSKTIKIINSNRKLDFRIDIDTFTPSGNTLVGKKDFAVNETIHYNMNLYAPVGFNPKFFVLTIPDGQEFDESAGVYLKSQYNNLTGVKLNITKLNHNEYRVECDKDIADGGQIFLGFQAKVTESAFSTWPDEKGKDYFSPTVSFFFKDDKFLNKTAAQVSSEKLGHSIVLDTPLDAGGLDGNTETNYRYDYNRLSPYLLDYSPYYWRKIIYPGVSIYQTNQTETLALGDDSKWKVYITSKMANGKPMEEDPYVIVVLPKEIGYKADSAVFKYSQMYATGQYDKEVSIKVEPIEKKLLDDGRTLLIWKLDKYYDYYDGWGNELDFTTTSHAGSGYGTKTIISYMVPTIEFYPGNIRSAAKYAPNAAYADLTRENGLSYFVNNYGANLAVKAQGTINYEGSFSITSSASQTGIDTTGQTSVISSGTNTLSKFAPGTKYKYTANMTNASTQNFDFTNITVINQLPYIGDKDIITGNPIGSVWTPEFLGISSVKVKTTTISATDYTVYITRDVPALNYTNEDWAGNNGAVNWELYEQDNNVNSFYADVKAIRIIFNSNVIIPYNKTTLSIDIDVKVPENIVPSQVPKDVYGNRPAYNTFGWKLSAKQANAPAITLNPFAPLPVGSEITDPKTSKIDITKKLYDSANSLVNNGNKVFGVKVEGPENYLYTGELSSTNNHKTSLTGLAYGDYTVTEIYEKVNGAEIPLTKNHTSTTYKHDSTDGNTFTINYTLENNPINVEITNKQKPTDLIISKTSQKTVGGTVYEISEGVKFELRQNNNIIKTGTTGTDGKLTFEDLPMGDYQLVEYSPKDMAASGFTTDKIIHTIDGKEYIKYTKDISLPFADSVEETSKVISNISVVNNYDNGKVSVNKTWNVPSGEVLDDRQNKASFYLLGTDNHNENVRIDLSYDQVSQKYINESVGYGNYDLYESTISEYEPNETDWTYSETLNDGKTLYKYNDTISINKSVVDTVAVENIKVNAQTITIKKVVLDVQGNSVDNPNRVFEIAVEGPNGYALSNSNNKLTAENDYTIVLSGLEYGEYTVTETSEIINSNKTNISDAYSETIYKVNNVPGNKVELLYDNLESNHNVVITNKEKAASLTINKTKQAAVGSTVYNPQNEIEFELVNNGSIIKTGKTNSSGELIFDDVAWGEYTLVEYSPANYKPAGFEKDGIATDRNGTKVIKYTKNIKIPDINENAYVLDSTLNVKNALDLGMITINKTFKTENSTAISDVQNYASFYLQPTGTNSENDRIQIVYDETTKKFVNDTIVFGTYDLYEISDVKYAPEGEWSYVSSQSESKSLYKYNSVITFGADAQINLDIVNAFTLPKGITISKEVRNSNDEVVSDFDRVFGIEVKGPFGFSQVYELEKANNYTLTLKIQAYGAFTVKEVYEKINGINVSPEENYSETKYFVNGSEKSDFTQSFENKNDEIEVKIVNKEKPAGLNIIKSTQKAKNSTDFVATNGIEFELYDNNNEKVKEGVTNDQGQLNITDIPWGKYSLVEYSPVGLTPEGFVKDSDVIERNGKSVIKYVKEITIPDFDNNGLIATTNLQVKNALSVGKLTINKTWNAGDVSQRVASFYLQPEGTDNANNRIELQGSNNKFTADSLTFGKFSLYEETNSSYKPNGDWTFVRNINATKSLYVYNNTINITNENEISINVKNIFSLGNVKINKVFSDNTHKPIEGKEFKIVVQNVNTNETIPLTLNSNMLSNEMKNLTYGTYKIKEISMPEDYSFNRIYINSDDLSLDANGFGTFIIDENAKDLIIYVENKFIVPEEIIEKPIIDPEKPKEVIEPPIINTPDENITENNNEQQYTFPENAIPLANNRVAVKSDAGDDIYDIFDENGTPLGYVKVPKGKTIEDMDLEKDLIPFAKVNPKTGQSSNYAVVFLNVSLLFGAYFYLVERKKQEIK